MKNNVFSKLLILLAIAVLHISCNDDDKLSDDIIGLWQQESITEDGIELPMTGVNEDVRLLIEENGVYRSYAKNSPEVSGAGSWHITDDKWVEFSVDVYHLNSENEWSANHVIERFTVLNLSNTTMQIRLKTFVGEMKYSTIFAAKDLPDVTDENLETIREEYKTLKTYVFTFKRK